MSEYGAQNYPQKCHQLFFDKGANSNTMEKSSLFLDNGSGTMDIYAKNELTG